MIILPTLDTKILIYFDTNILQDFFNQNDQDGQSNKKRFFLYGFKLSNKYYDLVRYIEENGLVDKVKIYIPKIVIEEMKEHLISSFKSENDSLKNLISNYKKIFGDLLNINSEIAYNVDDYEKYIINDMNTTIQENKLEVVEYPACFDSIIENSLKTIKPFSTAKRNSKEFSDAGFKDALLIESIKNHCNIKDNFVILYSNDSDFDNVINDNNFKLCRTYEAITKYLDDIYQLSDILKVKIAIKSEYHRELLLNCAEFKYDKSVSNFIVDKIEEIEEGVFSIEQRCIVNEAKYTFNYKYDSSSNEIIECEYKISNE